MKVYTTRYALTAGIQVHEVKSSGDDEKYVYTVGRYSQQFVMGKDAFLTYEEAAVAAREMRDKRELALKRQITKVSALIFPMRMPDNLKEVR